MAIRYVVERSRKGTYLFKACDLCVQDLKTERIGNGFDNKPINANVPQELRNESYS